MYITSLWNVVKYEYKVTKQYWCMRIIYLAASLYWWQDGTFYFIYWSHTACC